MQLQQVTFVCIARERSGRSVAPHIRSVASELAKLNIIVVSRLARFEDQHQFVLTSIERAHSGITFHPYANVLEFRERGVAGREQFLKMSPVNAKVHQSS